jgi:hypothetical protein
MGKQTTTGSQASRIVWDGLKEWVRRKAQEFIQSVLEEKITEVLGRQKSERRRAVDGSLAYRNGYSKERKLTLGCGTIMLRRPRVRGLKGRFESRVLPQFARRTKGVSELIRRLWNSVAGTTKWSTCLTSYHRSFRVKPRGTCKTLSMQRLVRRPRPIVESSFAGLRLGTDAAKRYKKVENAMAVIWKMLLLVEQRFQRLNAPEKLIQVYLESAFREKNEETETKQEEVLAVV